MKQLYFVPLLLSLFFPFLSVSAQTTEEPTSPIAFTLLNKIPTASISDCSSQDLEALMNENAKEWISSVECDGVSVNANKGGVILKKFGEDVSSITFKFNSTKRFKVTRVRLYGSNNADYSTISTNPIIKVNNNVVDQESVQPFKKYSELTNTDYSKWCTCNTVSLESIPLEDLTIIPTTAEIRIVAVVLYFSGIEEGSEEGGDDGDDNGEDNPGVSTGVNGVQQDATASYEYFDMQGRRLKSAPVSGLYIRRSAGKTEKLIAR